MDRRDIPPKTLSINMVHRLPGQINEQGIKIEGTIIAIHCNILVKIRSKPEFEILYTM